MGEWIDFSKFTRRSAETEGVSRQAQPERETRGVEKERMPDWFQRVQSRHEGISDTSGSGWAGRNWGGGRERS